MTAALILESATLHVTISGKEFPLTASLSLRVDGETVQMKTIDLLYHADAATAISVGKLQDFLADLQDSFSGAPHPPADLVGAFRNVVSKLKKVPVVGPAADQIEKKFISAGGTEVKITDIEVHLSETQDAPPLYKGMFLLGLLFDFSTITPPVQLFNIALVAAGVKFGFEVEISRGQWLP